MSDNHYNSLSLNTHIGNVRQSYTSLRNVLDSGEDNNTSAIRAHHEENIQHERTLDDDSSLSTNIHGNTSTSDTMISAGEVDTGSHLTLTPLQDDYYLAIVNDDNVIALTDQRNQRTHVEERSLQHYTEIPDHDVNTDDYYLTPIQDNYNFTHVYDDTLALQEPIRIPAQCVQGNQGDHDRGSCSSTQCYSEIRDSDVNDDCSNINYELQPQPVLNTSNINYIQHPTSHTTREVSNVVQLYDRGAVYNEIEMNIVNEDYATVNDSNNHTSAEIAQYNYIDETTLCSCSTFRQ